MILRRDVGLVLVVDCRGRFYEALPLPCETSVFLTALMIWISIGVLFDRLTFTAQLRDLSRWVRRSVR